jgi:hypothetical protein
LPEKHEQLLTPVLSKSIQTNILLVYIACSACQSVVEKIEVSGSAARTLTYGYCRGKKIRLLRGSLKAKAYRGFAGQVAA